MRCDLYAFQTQLGPPFGGAHMYVVTLELAADLVWPCSLIIFQMACASDQRMSVNADTVTMYAAFKGHGHSIFNPWVVQGTADGCTQRPFSKVQALQEPEAATVICLW